jgi:hypothetical protein
VPEKNALKLFGFVFLGFALAILFMLVSGYRSKVGPLVIALFAAGQSSAWHWSVLLLYPSSSRLSPDFDLLSAFSYL